MELSTERVRTAVTAYLQEIDAPVSTWEALVSLSQHEDYGDDAAAEREAFDHTLDRDPDRECFIEHEDAHTLAPALARAIFRSEDRGNGWRVGKTVHEPPRLDAAAREDGDWNRKWVTVFLDSLLSCILETQRLDDVQLAIIDPKLTNFMFFRDLPNLVTGDIITEADEVCDLLDQLVNEEISRRKEILTESASVDIVDHNSRADNPLSPMVVVVDEYADLLDAAEDDADQMETNVRRIAQIARSVGIHLVIATQRPSANIINTDLWSNLDMRAAFRVPSDSD